MPSLTFRSAAVHDLERVMELEAAGFAPDHREAREVYAQRIEAFAAGSLIAYLGTRSVGCLFSEIWPSGAPRAEHFALGHDIRQRHDARRGNELYVASMTLDPAFRGRGLGGALLAGGIEHVAHRHPRLRSALLLVNASWQRARRIYIAQGFHEVARFPAFFAPAEEAIVMRRAIR